jgi:hypothetical protein
MFPLGNTIDKMALPEENLLRCSNITGGNKKKYRQTFNKSLPKKNI